MLEAPAAAPFSLEDAWAQAQASRERVHSAVRAKVQIVAPSAADEGSHGSRSRSSSPHTLPSVPSSPQQASPDARSESGDHPSSTRCFSAAGTSDDGSAGDLSDPADAWDHRQGHRLPAELLERLTPVAQPPPPPPCLPFDGHPYRGLRHALYQPPWHPATMRGRLRRVRGASSASASGSGSGSVTRFDFSLELLGGAYELRLLSARKLLRALTPYYALSLDQHDVSRDSPHYLGKLRASSLGGLDWALYDHGLPEREARKLERLDAAMQPAIRRQLLSLQFGRAHLGGDAAHGGGGSAPGLGAGPPALIAVVPVATAAGVAGGATVTGHGSRSGGGGDGEGGDREGGGAAADDSESLVRRWRQGAEGAADGPRGSLFALVSRAAVWDASRGAYTLEYDGRAARPSVKNVQLAAGGTLRFQMGKLGRDEFTVDWCWPLSPIAAFGIALALCDAKLALLERGPETSLARTLLRAAIARPRSAARVAGASRGRARVTAVVIPVDEGDGGADQSGATEESGECGMRSADAPVVVALPEPAADQTEASPRQTEASPQRENAHAAVAEVVDAS